MFPRAAIRLAIFHIPPAAIVLCKRRISIRLALAAVLCLALPAPAFAQEDLPPTEPPTRIEADNDEHVIRFIVNGKEVGRPSEQGLEVENSIVYGGTITDRGRIPGNFEDGEVSDAP